ncbi:MAG: Fur family transcriptional regulator, ferric uptake regulator [Solirubrobacterales bacterium]|nr:Fur family transcriptional regulator, ferric uptake regulator [Solirubrobacterales bacterium]
MRRTPSAPRSTESEAELAERLSRAGIKPTAQRLAVLAELAREADDATAQALHRRLATAGTTIGLATIYRALNSFAAAGVIDAMPHQTGETCYRLCSEGHHHHLVCSRCHHVVELGDCRLGPWLDAAAQREDFVATGHRLEVTGICAACRGGEASAEASAAAA